jgi:hypothetical protein
MPAMPAVNAGMAEYLGGYRSMNMSGFRGSSYRGVKKGQSKQWNPFYNSEK